ncbi:MAG: NAD(P)/FAD-dependent oxidoreductase [Chloroflexota bacterium]
MSRRWPRVWAAKMAAGLVGALLYLVGRERKRDADAPILGGWPRVVVIGAGFGGLRTARALAGAEVEVTLLDQHNYHLFQPLLYQVATAAVEPEEIAHPVRRILKRTRNVRFRLAAVQGLDLAERTVLTDGGPVPYDYLVVASGSTTNYFGIPHLEERALSLKNLDQAVALRNHLLEQFERVSAEADPQRRAAMLTFVVAGGGPTGVEYAGALAELIRLVLVQDYPALDTRDVRVVLVEGAPHLLPPMADGLRKSALKKLRQKGVEVRLGTLVKGYDGERIALSDGSGIASHTLVWNAGVRATDLGQALGVELARGGRVPVQPTLQLAGHAEVFVIGDLAYLELKGAPLPMLAPVAMQQGEHAAAMIRRNLAGQPAQRFRYRDRGTMATIGRNAAVAQIGRLEVTGFFAWVLWLTVHILLLVGFRNRLLVMVNWAWDYLFFDRAVRLISQ